MDNAAQAESASAATAPVRLRAVPIEHTEPDAVATSALGNLPRPLTSLIGREADVAAACALLVEDGLRLLTVTGPGGVGKTRLALGVAEAAATAFADGVVFVPLAAVSDASLVLSAIARALDVREASGRSLLESLVAALQDRRLLLVLDNFEHLLAAAGTLSHLLGACPDLTVLVTSRAPLQLSGERRFTTSPLSLPDLGDRPAVDALAEFAAIALFVDRARWVRRGFALNEDNAADVVGICRRLDGLPLAIELAAAWMRILTPTLLLERLGQRLLLLRGGAEDQPARLHTMRDAIAWSYDLLTPAEARLFRRLAVFVGGFTLEAVEAIGCWLLANGSEQHDGRESSSQQAISQQPIANSQQPDALDLLAGLIDKSLLQMQTDGPDARFLMLETVREFALEQLIASGEAEAMATAHAAYMAAFAERAEPHLLGPQERQWRLRCDAELGNLRAALAWSLDHDNEIALRIGAPLWLYWDWNHLEEGRRWLRAALDRAANEPVLTRARALTTYGALSLLAGDVATGTEFAAPAVSLAVASGDVVTEGLARWVDASRHFYGGSMSEAGPEYDQALTLLEQATTSTVRTQTALVRSNRAVVAFARGDTAAGIALCEAALAQARAAESDAMTLILLGDLAGWLIHFGEDVTQARVMAEEALALASDHAAWLAASPLSTLALVAAREGDMVTAARRIGAMDAAWRRAGLEVPPHYQQRIDRAARVAAQALGEAAYDAARAAGRADLHAVVAEARSRPNPTASTTGAKKSADASGLTTREREVLTLLATGQTDKEIAAALSISRRTASNHVAALRAKLEVPSRAALAAIAVRDGLA